MIPGGVEGEADVPVAVVPLPGRRAGLEAVEKVFTAWIWVQASSRAGSGRLTE